MKLSRRQALRYAGVATSVALVPISFARVAQAETTDAIMAFTGGATPAEGGVEIIAAEIAENGNTVPISVSADGATDILILADGNPNPGVATFHFGKHAAAEASTRIRLAGTQNVVAVAKLGDGSFVTAARSVKVTIGGCGG